jgi:hypothetical protein
MRAISLNGFLLLGARVFLQLSIGLSVLPVLAWDTNDWEFLDTIEKTHFRALRESKVGSYQLVSDGIVYDNPYYLGPESSVAGIGFKLTAMCIGHYRGWIDYGEAYTETLRLLRTFGNELSADPNVFPRVNGWTYHFYRTADGTIAPNDGLSVLDHMLFMAGVIFAGEYFKGTEVGDLALRLYSETQWDNTSDGDSNYTCWGYAENLLSIIEAADAPQHNKHYLASDMWATVTASIPYHRALYMWQYPHAYIDFRFRQDPRGLNHAAIARDTILHQRQWCMDRFNAEPTKYETYTNATFGLSACGASDKYRILDAIDELNCDSGSITPIAIPPCMIFASAETMATLKYLFEEYYIKGCTSPRIPIWSVYGFANCYNIGVPNDTNRTAYYNGWNGSIDYGPNVLLLENYRLGTTWRYFMQNPSISNGMNTVGFGPPQHVSFADFTDATNQFGGGLGHWENGGVASAAAYVSIAPVNAWVGGHVVRLTAEGSHVGGWIDLGGTDQRGAAQLSFWLRGHTGQERIQVGLKDFFDRENKADLLDFTEGVMPTNWTEVKIPLETFCVTGVVSNDIWPGNLQLISFEFTNNAGGGLDVDYLAFGRDTRSPAAPTGHIAIAHHNGYPRVRWEPMDVERDVAGYSLWRRIGGTGDFVRVNRLLAPTHQRWCDDLNYHGPVGQVVEYAIRAVDNAEPPNSSSFGPSNSFVYVGGDTTDVDGPNGRNPNVFGGTNDGYWGAATPQSFAFVEMVLPNGSTGWVRRSYVSSSGGGHYVDLAGGDAGDSWALTFYIRGAVGGEGLWIGMKDSDNGETKVDLSSYISEPIGVDWARVIIPFSDFTNVNQASLNNISFTHMASSTVYIAELGFFAGQRSTLLNSHRMEAEYYVAGRGGQTRDFKIAASGREVLGMSWGESTNDFAQYDFYFDCGMTGLFLNARYSCWAGDGRVINLLWDGTSLEDMLCVNTGGWGEEKQHFQWTSHALPVITSGWHRLTLTIPDNDSPVNVDCFEVTEVHPWFRECERYDFQEGASIRDYKVGASGGEVLGQSWGRASNSVAIYSNVGARALSGAWFHLWYSLDAPSGGVVDVFVDDALKARLVCPPTGGWGDRACEFDRASAFLGDLGAGPHVVRLTAPNGGLAINLDGFCFSESEPEGLAGDQDGDGLSDRQENVAGTSAAVVDSDGDGLADGKELQAGFYEQVSDPTLADTDADGLTDQEEAVAGTNPRDRTSIFRFNGIRVLDGLVAELRWTVVSGRWYRLYYATGPFSNNALFVEIGDSSNIVATGGAARYVDSNAVPSRLYRLGVRRGP